MHDPATTTPLTTRKALRRLGAQLLLSAAVFGTLSAIVPRRPVGGDLAALRARVATERPELVLVGNSLVRQGILEAPLASELGRRVCKLTSDGSQSAWWYLALKNVVVPAEIRPRVVAIGFQDFALTRPEGAATGEYGERLRALMDGEEPLVRALALEPALGAARYFALEHVRLYGAREPARATLERFVRDGIVAPALGLPYGGGTRAFALALSNQRMDREALAAYQVGATKPEPEATSFARSVDASFLPPMVELARAAGVRLVFLRMPRLADARGRAERAALSRYIAELAAWLTARDVLLVDFTQELALEIGDFDAGDHLAPRGAQRLTERLGLRLRPLFE